MPKESQGQSTRANLKPTTRCLHWNQRKKLLKCKRPKKRQQLRSHYPKICPRLSQLNPNLVPTLPWRKKLPKRKKKQKNSKLSRKLRRRTKSKQRRLSLSCLPLLSQAKSPKKNQSLPPNLNGAERHRTPVTKTWWKKCVKKTRTLRKIWRNPSAAEKLKACANTRQRSVKVRKKLVKSKKQCATVSQFSRSKPRLSALALNWTLQTQVKSQMTQPVSKFASGQKMPLWRNSLNAMKSKP